MTHRDKKVLDWCNSIRVREGLDEIDEIQGGVKHSCFKCPIAETLGGLFVVGYSSASRKNREAKTINMPDYVNRWICSFDKGRLKRYETR